MQYRDEAGGQKENRLVIYFSGYAATGIVNKKGKDLTTVKVFLSDTEQIDLREIISVIDKIDREDVRRQLDEKEYSEEEREKYMQQVGRFSHSVKIIYDIVNPEMFKQNLYETYKYLKHYWKCYRLSKSSPDELVMLNKDDQARNKVLVKKMELGSFNTELLYNYLEVTGPLPLYAFENIKGKNNTSPSFTKPSTW